MQEAYEFLVRMLAGIANFLYTLIIGVRDVVVDAIAKSQAAILEALVATEKAANNAANVAAEAARASDERLQQIQQSNKDQLGVTTVVLDTAYDIRKRQDGLENSSVERFNALDNVAKETQSKVNQIADSVNAGIDNQAIEDTFYKRLHEDIAKYVRG
jgi:hypothetical protein